MLVYTKDQLSKLTVSELKAIAKENSLKKYSTLRKTDLIEFIHNNLETFNQPITYVYNDNLQMYSITNLDYLNLSIKDMTQLIIDHCQDKPFSNQVMNEKELKACYRAGFRVRGHETLTESETIEMFNNNAHTLQLTANTTKYNMIKAIETTETNENTVEEATEETNIKEETIYTVGRNSFPSYDEALQYCEMWNINPRMIYDPTKTTYSVGNKIFSSHSEAIQYCISNDFDPDIMIQSNNTQDTIQTDCSSKDHQDTNDIHWYQYTLRGFSLGCQPSGFIQHIPDIGKYGIISYNRPLTQQEQSNYDLIPYTNIKHLKPA